MDKGKQIQFITWRSKYYCKEHTLYFDVNNDKHICDDTCLLIGAIYNSSKILNILEISIVKYRNTIYNSVIRSHKVTNYMFAHKYTNKCLYLFVNNLQYDKCIGYLSYPLLGTTNLINFKMLDGDCIIISWEDYTSFSKKINEFDGSKNSKISNIKKWLNKFGETFYKYYVDNIRDTVEFNNKENGKNICDIDNKQIITNNVKKDVFNEDIKDIQENNDIIIKNENGMSEESCVSKNVDNADNINSSIINEINLKNTEIKKIITVKKDTDINWNSDTHFNMNIYDINNYI